MGNTQGSVETHP